MYRLVLAALLVLSLSACVPKDSSLNLQNLFDDTPEIYYVHQSTPVFENENGTNTVKTLPIGTEVTLLDRSGEMAQIKEGWVRFKDLESERSIFQLSVQVPKGATVKVLNIKPKYHDGMWLKKGKYHIGVYPAGKPAMKRWINLDDDRVLVMDGSNTPKRVQLTVNAPAGSTIKILNIKPKYRDGIELNAGKYHLAVYQGGHKIYDEWKKIADDTTIDIQGKAAAPASVKKKQASVAPAPAPKSGRTKAAPAPKPEPVAPASASVSKTPKTPAKQARLNPVLKALKDIPLMPLPKQDRPRY